MNHHHRARVMATMRPDLNALKDVYVKSSWPRAGEPIIGNPDCPALAEKYAPRGSSCYQVFVYWKDGGTFGCRHEECFRDGIASSPSFRSLTEAIGHQRVHHF
jgi:hypothetical protein